MRSGIHRRRIRSELFNAACTGLILSELECTDENTAHCYMTYLLTNRRTWCCYCARFIYEINSTNRLVAGNPACPSTRRWEEIVVVVRCSEQSWSKQDNRIIKIGKLFRFTPVPQETCELFQARFNVIVRRRAIRQSFKVGQQNNTGQGVGRWVGGAGGAVMGQASSD